MARRNLGSDLLTRTNLNWLFQREDTRYRRLSGNSLAAGGVDNAFNAVNCGGFATGCYTSSKTSQRLMGVGGGVGLEYKERYIADGLVRRDGSSLFGSDNRWTTYYRGSLAWRVAQEPDTSCSITCGLRTTRRATARPDEAHCKARARSLQSLSGC